MEEKEIRRIIDQLTLEEKAALCEMIFIKNGNEADIRLGSVPRFGIDGIRNCDNAEGGDYVTFQNQDTLHGEHRTCYPQAAALAATFDRDTVRQVGAALARDARSGNTQMLLRPGVNIKRTPLCGRNFEYYSEDPVLAGQLAGAFIRGIQSRGVAACLKHYCANNHEYDRMTANAVIGERALREIYLRAFEIAIETGKPQSIMTSYNKVNGEWTASNRHLLHDILRGEWGYDGVVVSDGGGIQTNKVEAHRNGLDVELSGPENTDALLAAVRDGRISEKELDAHCFRTLRLVASLSTEVLPEAEAETQFHTALDAAEKSGILLKNEHALPLREGEAVAVIGALAKRPHYMGGGSGHTNARNLTKAYDSMCQIAGNLPYAAGYRLDGREDVSLLREAAALAASAERTVVFVGLPEEAEWEGFDRADLSLPEVQNCLLEAVFDACAHVTVVVCAGSAVDLRRVMERADSVLFWYYAGEAMGLAQARTLYGLCDPAGRLPETFPMRLQDTPAYLSSPRYPNPEHNIVYGEGIYVGYRWYDKREIAPLLPFGYGLSYTSFRWSEMRVAEAEGSVNISVKVANTGTRPGSETVQLYVRPLGGTFDRPLRELKGFETCRLAPGEERTLHFTLDRRDFSCYSEEQNKWIEESGDYALELCRSSRDVVCSETIHRTSADRPYRFTPMSSLEHIMKAENLSHVLRDFPEEVRDTLLRPQEGSIALSFAFPIFRQLKNAFGLFKLTQEQLDTLLRRLNGEED